MAVLSATFFRDDDEDDLLQQKLLKTKLYMAHLRGGSLMLTDTLLALQLPKHKLT